MKPAELSLGDFLRKTSPEITQLVELPQQTLLVLLSHVLEQPQTWILAHSEAELSATQQAKLTALIARLKQGKPLPYLTGRQEFFGLSFEVSPAVLIPRPETELLVETALRWLRSHPAANSAVDVGTGSGCIAVSLAVTPPPYILLQRIFLPSARDSPAQCPDPSRGGPHHFPGSRFDFSRIRAI